MNTIVKHFISLVIFIAGVSANHALAIDVSKWGYDDLCEVARKKYAHGDYEGALTFFDKAVSAAPNNPEGYLNRGGMYAILKNNDNAIQDEQRAIELAKEDTRDNIFIRCFAHQNLSAIYLKSNQLTKAEAEARIAINLCSEEPSAQESLADVLIKNGKRSEALYRLKKAKRLCAHVESVSEPERIDSKIAKLQSK